MPLPNIFCSLIMFFLAVLLVWLHACHVIAAQETGVRELSGEMSRLDTDDNESADSAITAWVKAAISEEPSLRDEEIGVETRQGNVRLTGRVSSILVMEKAVEVAREVKGVRAVKDEMQFKWQY
jgi:osmotically-inducible protein OsmY